MSREENLIKTISFANSKLKKAPDGTLIAKVQHGHLSFYQRICQTSPKEIYLNSQKTELIKGLQEKAYYSELLQAAEKELKSLTKIKKIQSQIESFENVYLKMAENKRTLISPYISPYEEEMRRAIEKECKSIKGTLNDRKGVEKNIQLVTLNGERVRSKSELIIADRLKLSGIPYVYEGKYLLVDEEARDYEVWFPDFQMFNIRTGARYFWEHFGLMDNPDYCASCQYKLETYAKYGIVQGKNLITTMESSKHSLNTEYVDCLINTFLK